MKLSCLHTHSVFCDGTSDIETMCRAAHEKGLASIGFSSHAPIAKKTGIITDWHMQDEALDRYIAEVRAAQKRWSGRQLDVYLGLEVDFIAGLCGPADRDFQELPLDYIIGSVHYVRSPETGELCTVDCPPAEFKTGLTELFGGDGAALYHCYFDAYRAMLDAGGFDIAGHLDLIKKNNNAFHFFSPDDPAYAGRLLETAEHAAAGVVIEVNTGGMNRGAVHEPYPSPPALKRLRERGAPLVITADAHAPEHLGGHYTEAVHAMKEAGFTGTVLLSPAGKGPSPGTDNTPRWITGHFSV